MGIKRMICFMGFLSACTSSPHWERDGGSNMWLEWMPAAQTVVLGSEQRCCSYVMAALRNLVSVFTQKHSTIQFCRPIGATSLAQGGWQLMHDLGHNKMIAKDHALEVTCASSARHCAPGLSSTHRPPTDWAVLWTEKDAALPLKVPRTPRSTGPTQGHRQRAWLGWQDIFRERPEPFCKNSYWLSQSCWRGNTCDLSLPPPALPCLTPFS